MYVQQRIGTKYSYLWKHLLQMAFICFALLCSISRIIDRRHHWWDVLAGCVIGAIFACLTVRWHANNFSTVVPGKKIRETDEADFHNPNAGTNESSYNVRYRGSTTTM